MKTEDLTQSLTHTFTCARSEAIAVDVDARFRAHVEALARMLDGASSRRTVADLADKFEQDHLGSVKPTTARLYRTHLRQIRSTLGDVTLDELGRAHVVELMRSCEGEMMGREFVLRLRQLLRYAEHELGWSVRDPSRAVKLPQRRRKDRVLTDSELAKLFTALASTTHDRTYLACRLLALTGMRLGETLALRWRDVDVERSRLWVELGKTGSRWVPVGAQAMALLADLRSGRDLITTRDARHGIVDLPPPELDAFVFAARSRRRSGVTNAKTVRGAMRRASEAAGIEHVHPHLLRHNFASRALLARVPLPVVSRLLGHSCPSVTLRSYAHVLAGPVQESADELADSLTKAMVCHVQ